MGCIVVFLFLREILLYKTQTVSAEKLSGFNEYIHVRSHDCDTKYDADDYNILYLEYHGSDILASNPCSVEFTKSSYSQYICISADKISLDCDTKLEYHEYFVKNYITPEKRVSCNVTTVEEWCPSQYQDNIFVVIRKQKRRTSDLIKLRIYLKPVPDDSYLSSVSSTVLVSAIVPIVFVVVFTLVAICRIRAKRTEAAGRPQVLYQTTTRTVNAQTGNTRHGQVPQGYSPGQHVATPLIQGDYHVHPMQSAYPVTQNDIPEGVNSQRYPSATTMPPDAAPPPSYESVVGKQS